MLPRLLSLPQDVSYFLFGPRGCGKTTLVKHLPYFKDAIYINLLKADEERRFTKDPDTLIAIVRALPKATTHVIIDEIQKIPKLLDVVHELIETTDKQFVLTGSSARKLKYGGANLLAGRAFVYHLHTFSYLEIDDSNQISDYINWGMLPKIFEYTSDDHKRHFLEAYANTYLKEEIWAEQFIKKLDPFRNFLEIAAHANGSIINFSNIASDVGVDIKTIQKYFTILADTLIGFFLNPFQHSFRKRLSKAPKFYFFDTGVVKTLTNQLTIPAIPGTRAFGDLFESFIINQIITASSYYHPEYRFSYLKTKDGAEIDLIVERPGKKLLFIEIKSTDNVKPRQLTTLSRLAHDFVDCEPICFSQDKYSKQFDDVLVMPWADGIQYYFTELE